MAACDSRVYVAAQRVGPDAFDFGTGEVDGNLVVLAFGADGTTLWTRSIGYDDPDAQGWPLAKLQCAPGGDLLLYGVTAVDLDLDGVHIDGGVETSSNGFVIRLDGDGNALSGGLLPIYSYAVAMAPGGAIVAAGGDAENTVLMKLDANGDVVWRNDFPRDPTIELSIAELAGLAVAADGTISVSGSFTDEIDVGGGVWVNQDLPEFDVPQARATDAFVARYDADGVYLAGAVIGEVGHDIVGPPQVSASGATLVAASAPSGSRLVAFDALGATTVLPLSGQPHAIASTGTGGVALLLGQEPGVGAFEPLLTPRTPSDFVIVKLAL